MYFSKKSVSHAVIKNKYPKPLIFDISYFIYFIYLNKNSERKTICPMS